MVIGKAAGPNSNQKQETGNISNQELPKKYYCPSYFSFISADLLTHRHLTLYMHIFLIIKCIPHT